MELLTAIGAPEITAIGGSITALGAIYIALRKLSGETRGIHISNDQGAAMIYDNLVKTLQNEVERLNAENTALRAQLREAERATS